MGTYKGPLIAALIFCALLFSGIIPSAHAYSNALVNGGTCFNITSGTTCVIATGPDPHDCFNVCPSPIGSMVIIIVWTDVANTPVSISGAPVTQIYVNNVNPGANGFEMQVFQETTTNQLNQTITITSGAYGWGIGYYIFDTGFQNLVGQGQVLAPCSSSCTVPLQITGFPNRNNALELSIWSASIASSFSFANCGSVNCINYGTSGQNPGLPNAGYYTNGGVTLASCPTFKQCGGLLYYSFNIGGSYPSTITTATPQADDLFTQSLVVFLFQNTNGIPPPTPVVIACTAFQLQCYLYPLFVFGIYMILITGVARAVNVPKRDYIGHLLEGFSLAGMLCVIFGIVNVMFPLIVTIVQVIRAVRE